MHVLMVGCGNMGFALLKAWLHSGALAPADAAVVEPGETSRGRVVALNVKAFAEAPSPDEFAADLIVLAVKPQVMADIAPAYRPFTEKGAAVMTIAAGLSIGFYEGVFGKDVPIIRLMPNTPASIGEGMLAYIANDATPAETIAEINRLLKSNGAVVGLESEDQMDAVTAVSGSGPAYLFHFIEALSAAGEALGLPSETAALLARQTVLGAAKLAGDGETDPATLRQQVTSPNGTTAAGLAVMMQDDRLIEMMREVTEAARRRSVELSR